MSSFEFDILKSQANLLKHGIDFQQGQLIWDDPEFVEITAKSDDEFRAMVIGRIDDHHWSAIITYRDHRVRIISVRRSRESEITLYES